MRVFETGQGLCRAFHREVVAPLIRVPHSAGLLGAGSDVLGYDTERSTDHDWGPRAVIFVEPSMVDEVRAAVDAGLPDTFRGWPVSIGSDERPPAPRVEVTTLAAWCGERLGFDPIADGMARPDWLVTPQQRLLEVVAGAVFADDSGELTRLREMLAWYPDDVWWWMLACQWRRIAQEEPFVQRAAEAGDSLGSGVVAARLVRDSMRLALLMARRYAPYSKWLGTAFARLGHPDRLAAHLVGAMEATESRKREEHLGAAWQALAGRFNALDEGVHVDASLRPFHDRPATILGADRCVAAALAMVGDRDLRDLPLIGSIDQLGDSTDLLTRPGRWRELRRLYLG